MSNIDVEVTEVDGEGDAGVEDEYEVVEQFTRDGEQVTRTTQIAFLEDGGVNISQTIQGMYDVVTVSEDALAEIAAVRDGDPL